MLKQHRIPPGRHRDAACQAAVTGRQGRAAGATEAAVAHVRFVAERLTLVNTQLNNSVRRELDRLVRQLAGAAPAAAADTSTEDDPASSAEAILLSLPGIGNGVLATLLAEARRCCPAAGLRRATLSVRRGAGHPAFGQEPDRDPPSGGPTTDCATPPTTGPTLPPNVIRPATTSIGRRARLRPRTRARPALGGRSPAQRRLRDVLQRRLLRPAPIAST